MKNAIALLAVFLFTQINHAQTSYITVGGGYLPYSSSQTWSKDYYKESTQAWVKSGTKSGYSLYMGFGKQLLLNEHWSIAGEWQLERFETPIYREVKGYFQNNPEELQFQAFTKTRLEYTGLRLGLYLERSLDIGQHEITLLAGGFLRPKLRGWLKGGESHGIHYFEVDYISVWDSVCQCNMPIYFISKRYDPPLETGSKEDYENEFEHFRDINYGIYGGIGFPLFTSPEGTITGKVMVSKDFEPNLLIHGQKAEKQTNISAGIVFKPTNRPQSNNRKPGKKPLPSGIYSGISFYNILYLSLDGSWQSSSMVGFDLSVRELFVINDYSAVYIGPNYQLGNSHLFIKAGTEYLWRPNSEGSDEAFFVAHVGCKYIAPISKRIGLRFDAGYNFMRNTRQGYPGTPNMAIGLTFIPKA